MKKLVLVIIIVFSLIVLGSLYSISIEPNMITVVENNVNDLINIKSGELTFIQISDLHIKKCSRFEKKLVDKIIKLKPNFILFTGDMIDAKAKSKELEAFLELLPKEIEKFAILGNWEHWADIDIDWLEKLYIQNNCKLLINSYATFFKNDTSIIIIGLDDYTGGNPNIDFLDNINLLHENHILMTHSPIYRDVLLRNRNINVKFMLSGHTHGGQIRIFGKSPFLPQGTGKYIKGWFKDELPYLYISKGIGTSILPIRIGAAPEVTVFRVASLAERDLLQLTGMGL